MTAQQAFELSEGKIPRLDNKEYDSIIDKIKNHINNGKRDKKIVLLNIPSKEVKNRLKEDGYHLTEIKGGFAIPIWLDDYFAVSWEKKKFLSSLFNF